MNNYSELGPLLLETEIIDNRYPVKGGYIWLPYGVAIRERIVTLLKQKITELGYREYIFPRLIPKENLVSMPVELKNIENSLFWVTQAGKKQLNRPFFLYPTGECVVYPMFKKMITNENTLPIKLFQVSTIFRPTKDTSLLINRTEGATFIEGHSAYKSEEEAETEFRRIIQMLSNYFDVLGIPTLIVKRPNWGNKLVANITASFETYLPLKNKSISVAAVYLQGQIFSKAFDVKFKTIQGETKYTHQTTFGLSERVLAPMFLLQRDNEGLNLLPKIAPFEAVIIPLDNLEDERHYLNNIEETEKIKMFTDNGPEKPGKKIQKWRKKGVPIIIIIGKKEVCEQTLTVLCRNTKIKDQIKQSEISGYINSALEKIEKTIRHYAKTQFETNLKAVKTKDQLKQQVSEKHMVKFIWCEEETCGKTIEKDSSGEILGSLIDENALGSCLNCGKTANTIGLFSRRCTSP